MPDTLRLVIAGGGTGGHVQPAVAVMQKLRSETDVDALWIGSHDGFERGAAHENDIPFATIQTGKLRRYFSFQTPLDAVRIPLGTVQSLVLLRRFRPDVVFSTGGFISVPTIVAARLLHIPTLTHEQTATIGLATRINARFADAIALSFESSRSRLGPTRARVVVTGNPVRTSLFGGSDDRARNQFSIPKDIPLIYVTGGALGAHAINEAVLEALPRLPEMAAVLHQCGPADVNGDHPRLSAARAMLPDSLRSHYVVRERIGGELADVYAAASLVIGRAGAGTVAELAALGKPSILIPLPGAGGDEQTLNARMLADADAAILLPQDELTPDRLVHEVKQLLGSGRLDQMAAAARSCGRTDAAKRLAATILDLVFTNKQNKPREHHGNS